MKKVTSVLTLLLWSSIPTFATEDASVDLNQKIQLLERQTQALQKELNQLRTQLTKHPIPQKAPKQLKPRSSKTPHKKPIAAKKRVKKGNNKSKIHNSHVYVHTLNGHPESVEYNPTALLSEGKVVTYIAGTPVVTAPYLGSRPAYNGSDYIVNISSINRDLRLMEQRRQLYRAYTGIAYPRPNTPIIALSGKAEPAGTIGNSYSPNASNWDMNWDLGAAELDAAASLNHIVQAYLSLAYDPSPPSTSHERVGNSAVGLGMGFINIGDLDRSPFYFTAGQLYVPFGRFSSAMVSAPLPMIMGRTKARPFIFGYKSQRNTGPFAAIYGFKGDTTLNDNGVGGANLGYEFDTRYFDGEVGASFISSINNAGGMQLNGSSQDQGTFGGFGSILHGSEAVKRIPAVDAHATIRFGSYNITGEWITSTQPFLAEDLSYNGYGAQPQAMHVEAGKTFIIFHKPLRLREPFNGPSKRSHSPFHNADSVRYSIYPSGKTQ